MTDDEALQTLLLNIGNIVDLWKQGVYTTRRADTRIRVFQRMVDFEAERSEG